jgi:hypothetical protein
MNAITIKPLPDAIARRNPWPERGRAASPFLPCGSPRKAAATHDENVPNPSRRTAWTVDDVTISACALLGDDILDAICETLTASTAPMSVIAACGPYAAHPPLAHLWRGIESIELHAFAQCHVMAAVRFTSDAGGGLVYADGSLSLGGTVPETVRLQALGTDMEGLLPHPLFYAHRWREEQREAELLNGPSSCRLLGEVPGLQLARLARADRESLLQAGAELGLVAERGQAAMAVDHPGRRDED